MTRIKGLEALFCSNQKELKSKEDCVVAALHCILINADLLCVGIGEVFLDNDSDSATELLPEKWNDNQDVYCLRYRDQDLKQCFLLKIAKAGNHLHLNLVKDEDISSSMTVNTDDFVSEDYKQFSRAFKELGTLSDCFQQDILEKVQIGKDKSSSSSKKESAKKESPKKATSTSHAVPTPQFYPLPVGTGRHGSSPLSVFPQIGGNDLDPFGRGQGSMHFDPLRRGVPSRDPFGRDDRESFMGLPPHSIPQGARFDPFMPNIPGARFKPDPDQYKPPDYDNMFM